MVPEPAESGTRESLEVTEAVRSGALTFALKAQNSTGAVSAVSMPGKVDRDGDGMPDYWELIYFGNLDRDGKGDYDSDGLTDREEYFHNTDPTNPDTSGDGIPDGWLVFNQLHPLMDNAADDQDGDGFTNLEEYRAGSRPWDYKSYPGSDIKLPATPTPVPTASPTPKASPSPSPRFTPLSGDSFDDPLPLSGTIEIEGSTADFSDQYQMYSGSPIILNGRDIVYAFTSDFPGNLEVRLSDWQGMLGIFVCPLPDPASCREHKISYREEELTVVTRYDRPGEPLYLVVDGATDLETSFSLGIIFTTPTPVPTPTPGTGEEVEG